MQQVEKLADTRSRKQDKGGGVEKNKEGGAQIYLDRGGWI